MSRWVRVLLLLVISTFILMGAKAQAQTPVITGISPASGKIGIQITITGQGLLPAVSELSYWLTIGGQTATTTNWTDTQIVATIPAGLPGNTTSVPIYATYTDYYDYHAISNTYNWTVVQPLIASMSPTSGVPGTAVTLTGSGFGATQGAGAVTFSGAPVVVTSWSDTKIIVLVPSGTGSGRFVVSMPVMSPSSSSFFTLTPYIASISPASGRVGTQITITGQGLLPAVSELSNWLTIGGQTATTTSWTDTQIVATIPSGLPGNTTSVPILAGYSDGYSYHSSTNTYNWTVVQPLITSMSPKSGVPGTAVTLTGSGFGATQGAGAVTFSGAPVVVTSWSDTKIIALVPSGIGSGTFVVSLSGMSPSSSPFFTLTPYIASISPTSGKVGTQITITGQGLLPAVSELSYWLTIGGQTATTTSWTDTQIVATIPAGLPGNTTSVPILAGYSDGYSYHSSTNTYNWTVVQPLITSMSPKSGVPGTAVTLTGSGFGAAQGAGAVTFSGAPVVVTSWSDTKIIVLVPSGTGSGTFVVSMPGMSPSSSSFFTLTPYIASISPTSGRVGTQITITGQGLLPAVSELSNWLTIGGQTATTTSWTDTQIVATIPSGLPGNTTSVPILAGYSDGYSYHSSTNTYNWTVVQPLITSMSPKSGVPGTAVTLTGSGFGATQGAGAVTFSGAPVVVSSWSDTKIIVLVPSGTGSGTFVVSLSGMSPSSSPFFTLTPYIASISPTSGKVGTQITITGQGLLPAVSELSSWLMIGGQSATTASWTDTQIVATIPAGLPGNTISVPILASYSNGYDYRSNTNTYYWTVVQPPVISSLSPSSGIPGTSVTLNGSGFGVSQGTSTVSFNGVAVTVASWSDTKIVVTSPSGATTGDVAVTVNGIVSLGMRFTVVLLPSIGSISPTSGPVATSVTVMGTNFGATQGTSTVTFNGTVALPTSWSDTRILVSVPIGATTGTLVVTVEGMVTNGMSYVVLTPPSITAISPAAGRPGTSITITGTNFGATLGTGTVTFVGVTAILTSWSDTKVMVLVPSGATTGDVVLTASGGTAMGNFTVLPAWSSIVATGNLNTNRFMHTSTLLTNGTTLIAGGWNSSDILASAELYNPAAGMFTGTGSLNYGREGHTATLLSDGRVLISGGLSYLGGALAPAELFNSELGAFSFTGPLNTARTAHTATLLNDGRVLIAGGRDYYGDILASAEIYDPTTGGFTPTGNMNCVRQYHTATLLNNGMILVTGGTQAWGHSTVEACSELYDPGTGNFTYTGSLNVPRQQHTATLLNTGQVLVVGGYVDSYDSSASSELYDPSTGVFTSAASMNIERGNHTATLLTNGTVLVAGGWTDTEGTFSTEVYDPRSDTFTGSINLVTRTANQTATLLGDGTVLLAGGMDTNSNILATAQLYEPVLMAPEGLVSIAVTPSASLTLSGLTQRFIATGKFADDNTEILSSAQWNSSDNSVASITDDATDYGHAYAILPGSAMLTACVGPICGQATLNVGINWVAVPTIMSLSPRAGPVGTQLLITGANFGTLQGTSVVTVSGVAAQVISWSDSQILVSVQQGASTGNVVVTVASTPSNEAEFTVTGSPSIAALSVLSGCAGTTLTISGKGFGPSQGGSSVTFNDVMAMVTGWSDAQLLVAVPSGATTGNVLVTVGGQASNGIGFAILTGPCIATLSPTKGSAGTPVTITGVNFGAEQGSSTVSFNGVAASPWSWSDTQIEISVPDNTPSGNVVVTVNRQTSNGAPFRVLTLVSITVTPANSIADIWAPLQFTATGNWDDGSSQDVTSTATWASTEPTVATVSCGTMSTMSIMRPSGATPSVAVGVSNCGDWVTPDGIGQATITAVVGNITGSTSLTVLIPEHTATRLNNGLILVAGGQTNSGDNPTASASLYDPATGTSTATGKMVSARSGHTATLLNNGKVLVTGGSAYSSDASSITVTASAELYDPGTGMFAATGSLNVGRVGHRAALLDDGRVLAIGGGAPDTSDILAAELYDPATGVFAPLGDMNFRHRSPTATRLHNGKVLVTGNGSSVELYDPSTRLFSPTGSFNFTRQHESATLLESGKVLITGGTTVGDAELYDPATATFSAAGTIVTNRADHAATLLNNGLVLIASGIDSTGFPTASLELYDPATSTFTSAGNLTMPHIFPTATLLNDGRVLIAGNEGNNRTLVASSELYQPAGPTTLSVVTLFPNQPSVSAGSVQNFTAVGTFTDGSTESMASAIWNSSNSTVVSVDSDSTNNGQGYAQAVGTSTISACIGVICGSSTMTVIPSSPNITFMWPTTGAIGAAVQIFGTGFGSAQGPSTISFNGMPATVTNWNPTSITALVPAGATTGNVVVTVDEVASNSLMFTVIPTPVIANVSPVWGGVNTPVMITGTNFGAQQGTLSFNGTISTPSSWSATNIVTSVPIGATSGKVVVTSMGGASNGVGFTVLPSIDSVSPVSGTAGTSVTITGMNFGAASLNGHVTFNGVLATTTGWSDRVVVAVVPEGAMTGPVVIVVGGASSGGVSFSIPPAIVNLSPTAGSTSTMVTINGLNFGVTRGSVTFNGVAATPTTWGPNKIVVPVPLGAATGPVVVTELGQASNAVNFVVGTGAIAGTVSQSSDGIPIGGALVEALQSNVAQASVTSAADGSFRISGLVPGTYDIRASAAGYGATLVPPSSIAASAVTTINVSLGSISTISGRVTQGDGVTPIADATITALLGPDQVGSAATDDSGAYTISSLGSGLYTVQATAMGYNTQSQGGISVTDGTAATANFSLAGQSVITYEYDDLGRLVGVVDSLNGAAVYSYDAVGNMLSISRIALRQASVLNFTPQSGPAGTLVTITGTGFIVDPEQDIVEFNGTKASVSKATSTQLSVLVPSGATTGPISLTVSGGSVTSSALFTVTPSTDAPAITGFTPLIASVGDVVKIIGSNFDTPVNDKVRFNLTSGIAKIIAADTNSISAVVPTTATSGRVTLTTPTGKTTSAVDFFVPPSKYHAYNVEVADRMVLGDTLTGTLDANQVGLIVFDGVAGHTVSFDISGPSMSASINNPDGTLLNYFYPLPTTGTYTVLVVNGASAGNFTLSLYDITADVTGTILIGGPAISVTTHPNQNAGIAFVNAQSQAVTLHWENSTYVAAAWLGVGDAGSYFSGDVDCTVPSGSLPLGILAPGTYVIGLGHANSSTGNVSLSLTSP